MTGRIAPGGSLDRWTLPAVCEEDLPRCRCAYSKSSCPISLDGVRVLLQDVDVVHVWTAGPPEAPGLVRILLDAHEAEQLSDRLVRRYGSLKGFRLILLPVEATQPAVEKPSAEVAADGGAGPRAVGPRRISREELYEDLAQASRCRHHPRASGPRAPARTDLAAVATFLVQQVRPRTWWEAERATRLAVTAWVVMLAALAALMFSGYVDAG